MKVTAILGAFFLAAVLVVLGSSAFAAGPATVTDLAWVSGTPANGHAGDAAGYEVTAQVIRISGSGFVVNGQVQAVTFFNPSEQAAAGGALAARGTNPNLDRFTLVDNGHDGACGGGNAPGSGQFCVESDGQIILAVPAHEGGAVGPNVGVVDVQVWNGTSVATAVPSALVNPGDRFTFTAQQPVTPAGVNSSDNVNATTAAGGGATIAISAGVAGGHYAFASTVTATPTAPPSIGPTGPSTLTPCVAVVLVNPGDPFAPNGCAASVTATGAIPVAGTAGPVTITGTGLGSIPVGTLVLLDAGGHAAPVVAPPTSVPVQEVVRVLSVTNANVIVVGFVNQLTLANQPMSNFGHAGSFAVLMPPTPGNFYVVNDALILLNAPAYAGGVTVDLTVTSAGGTSATNATDRLRYIAPQPVVTSISSPATAGTSPSSVSLTITGTGLAYATGVTFGGGGQRVANGGFEAGGVTLNGWAGSQTGTDTVPSAISTDPNALVLTNVGPRTGTGMALVGSGTAAGGAALAGTSTLIQQIFVPAGASMAVTGYYKPYASGAVGTQQGFVYDAANSVLVATMFNQNWSNTQTWTSFTSGALTGGAGGTSYTLRFVATEVANNATWFELDDVTQSLSALAGVPATITSNPSSTSVVVTVPAYVAASEFGAGCTQCVDVQVTTNGGTSTPKAADEYGYVTLASLGVLAGNVTPAAGPDGGGTLVDLNGAGFQNADTGTTLLTAATFGGKDAGAVTLDVTNPATLATVSAPSNTSGAAVTVSANSQATVLLKAIDTTTTGAPVAANGLYTYYGFNGTYSALVTGGTYTLTGHGFATGSTATWTAQVVNGGAAATPAVPAVDGTLGPLASGASVNLLTRLTDITLTSSNTTSFTLANSFTFGPLTSRIVGLSTANPADCGTGSGCTVSVLGAGFQGNGVNTSVAFLPVLPAGFNQITGQPFNNTAAGGAAGSGNTYAGTIGVGGVGAAGTTIPLTAALTFPLPSGTAVLITDAANTETVTLAADAFVGATSISVSATAFAHAATIPLTVSDNILVVFAGPTQLSTNAGLYTIGVTTTNNGATATSVSDAADSDGDNQVQYIAPPTVTAIFNNTGTRGAYNDGSVTPACPSATLFDSIAGGITAGANSYTVCGTGFKNGAANVVTNVQVSDGTNTYATATETTSSATKLTWAPNAAALPAGEYKVRVDSIYGTGTPSSSMTAPTNRAWETEIFTVYPNINAPNGGSAGTYTNGPLTATPQLAPASLTLDSVLGTTFTVNFLQGATLSASGADFVSPTTSISQGTVTPSGSYLLFNSVAGFTTGGKVDMQAVVNGIPSPATRPNDQFTYVQITGTDHTCSVDAPYGNSGGATNFGGTASLPCSNSNGKDPAGAAVTVNFTGVGFIDAFGTAVSTVAQWNPFAGTFVTSALTTTTTNAAKAAAPALNFTDDQVGLASMTFQLDATTATATATQGFVYYPEVTALSITSGPLAGAAGNTITGTGFMNAPATGALSYDKTASTPTYTAPATDTSITGAGIPLKNTPAGSGAGFKAAHVALLPGNVDVFVTINGVRSPIYRNLAGDGGAADVFSYAWITEVRNTTNNWPATATDCPNLLPLVNYQPHCGPVAGNTALTVYGRNLRDFYGNAVPTFLNFFNTNSDVSWDGSSTSAPTVVAGANATSMTVSTPNHDAYLTGVVSIGNAFYNDFTSANTYPGAFDADCAVVRTGCAAIDDTFTYMPSVSSLSVDNAPLVTNGNQTINVTGDGVDTGNNNGFGCGSWAVFDPNGTNNVQGYNDSNGPCTNNNIFNFTNFPNGSQTINVTVPDRTTSAGSPAWPNIGAPGSLYNSALPKGIVDVITETIDANGNTIFSAPNRDRIVAAVKTREADFYYTWIQNVTAPDSAADCPTTANGNPAIAFAAQSLVDAPGSPNAYAPNCGPTNGGSTVTITGYNFTDIFGSGANPDFVNGVRFFATTADLAGAQVNVTGGPVSVNSATSLTVQSPAHVAELRNRLSLDLVQMGIESTSGSALDTTPTVAVFTRDTYTFFPQITPNGWTATPMSPTSGGANGGTNVTFGGLGLDFTQTPPAPNPPVATSNPKILWDYTGTLIQTSAQGATDSGFGPLGTDDSSIQAISPAHQVTCGAVAAVINGVQSPLYGGDQTSGFCWLPVITAVSSAAPGSGQHGPTVGGNSVAVSGFGFNPIPGSAQDIPAFVPPQACVAPAVAGKTNGTLNSTVFPGTSTIASGGPFASGGSIPAGLLTLSSGSTYAIPANGQLTLTNSFGNRQTIYTSAAVAANSQFIFYKAFTATADFANGDAVDLPGGQVLVTPTNDRQFTILAAPGQWACTDELSVTVPTVDAHGTPIWLTSVFAPPVDNYTFVAPIPVITSILNNSAAATVAQTGAVVTGSGFSQTSIFNIVVKDNLGATVATVTPAPNPPSSDTTFTVDLPALATGVYDLVIQTDGGTSVNSASTKYYVGLAPTLTGATSSNYSDAPYASGPVLGTNSAYGQATVTVNGTGFDQTPLTVLVGTTPATNVVVVSPTKLTFTAPDLAAGVYDIHVNSAGGNSAATGVPASSYEAVAAPNATSTNLGSGPAAGNQSLTINGTNFAPVATRGGAAFSLSGTARQVTSWTIGGSPGNAITGLTATSFNSTTPAHTAGASNTVTTTDVYGTAGTANYVYVPSATSVTPNSGPATGGTTITIGGSGFGTVPASVTVTFSTAAAGVVTVTGVTTAADNSITLNTPANVPALANSAITVIVNGAYSNDVLYFNFLPTVTSVKNVGTNGTTAAPGAGATGDNQGALGGGYKIAVDGTGFDMTTFGNNTVTVGGTVATVTGFDGALGLIVTANAMAAGTYDVRVTTNSAQSPVSTADQFIYRGAPTLVSINPNSGPLTGGQTVNLTGTGIYPSTSIQPTVTIGGNALTGVTSTNTTASGVTPAATIAGRKDVVLTTAFGSSTLVNGYAYLPTVYAVTNPTTGDNQLPLSGATVTVTGTGFDVAANDSVSLVSRGAGAVVTGPIAVNTVTGTTSLTFTAPAGTAGAYDVRVRVNGVDSNVNNSTAFYRLGESVGATTAYDSSANGHGGTASAGVTYGQAGAPGFTGNNAAAFNGTTGVVTIPSFAPFTPNGGSRTVDFWMKTTNTTYMPLFSTGSPGTIGTYFFIGSVPANVGSFTHAAGIYVGTYGSDAVVPASVTDGNFHHIVVSESGSGSLNVYIDNVQPAGFVYTAGFGWSASSQPIALVAPITGATPVYLGYSNNLPAYLGSGNYYFSGTLDEVTVYSTIRGTQPAGSDSLVYQPAPTVGSFSPPTLAAGANAGTVNGTNYLDSILVHPTFTVSSAGVTGVTTVNPGQMTGSVTPSGAAGNRSVTATTAFGSATLANATSTLPTVTAVTNAATTDKQGALTGGYTVTVTGTLFDTAAGVNIVNLVPTGAGTAVGPITATSNTATSISFVMPANIGAGTYDVRVTTNGAQSAVSSPADNFVAVAPPTLTGINPNSGPTAAGTAVAMTGSNFVAAANQAVAFSIGGTNGTVVAAGTTSTNLNGTAPAGTVGQRNVVVTTAFGVATLVNAYTYTPTFTSIVNIGSTPSCAVVTATCYPATGDNQGSVNGGYQVRVTGTGFDLTPGNNTVSFNGLVITATGSTATTLTLTIPNTGVGAGTNTVTVRTFGIAAPTTGQFIFRNPPTIADIVPSFGTTGGGDAVRIDGTAFYDTVSVHPTATIGGASLSSLVVASSVRINGNTPAGTAGSQDVVVTTAFGSVTLPAGFLYKAPINVTGISPTTGPAAGGNTATITGQNLQYADTVNFGPATVTSFTTALDGSSITLTVPAGSGTATVTATDSTGFVSSTGSASYTYVSRPAVTSITPTSGSTAGGTVVHIVGTNLTCGSCTTSVTIGGTNAPINAAPAPSATDIYITTPAGPVGTFDTIVTTTYPGGTSTAGAQDQFTYVAPPPPPATPVLNNVTPGSGPNAGSPVNVILTGTGFTGATAVSFGSVVIGPAGPSTFSVNLAGTQITVNGAAVACATPSPCSTTTNTPVGVFVTTPGGNSGTQPYTFLAPASAPTITGIAPNSTSVGTAPVQVTITGTNFYGAVTVNFGAAAGTNVVVIDPQHLTVNAPTSNTPGSVDVIVNAQGGTATATGGFTYVAVCQNGGDQGRPWTGGSDVVGVAQATTSAFFAEGYTGANFHETIAIHNPNATAIQVSVQYLLGGGAGPLRSYSVPGKGRINIAVECDAGFNQLVSAKLTSSSNFVAERLMYFLFNSGFPGATNIDGGNAALGAQAAGTSWYFAEGYTGYGFAEFLTVANPNPAPTTVNVTYFYNNGAAPRVVGHTLGANSRDTYFVNNEAGANVDVAALVSSTLPVVAERPIYFNYPSATGIQSGGTIAVGSPVAGATDVNLAEGTTASNIDEYVTLLNSTGTDANVTIQYLRNANTPVLQTITVPANRRTTIHANDVLGNGPGGAGVASSLHITSSQAVLVERSMYFNIAGRTGGHSAMAVPTSALASTALFAAGAANLSNSQYLTFENPNAGQITVTMNFFDANGTLINSVPLAVAGNSRATAFVNDLVPQDRSFSIEITSVGGNFLVERPTYFTF